MNKILSAISEFEVWTCVLPQLTKTPCLRFFKIVPDKLLPERFMSKVGKEMITHDTVTPEVLGKGPHSCFLHRWLHRFLCHIFLACWAHIAKRGIFHGKGQNIHLWTWVEHEWKKLYPSLKDIVDGSEHLRFRSRISAVKSKTS